MSEQSQALITTSQYMPVMSMAEVIARRNIVVEFTRKAMTAGTDFGTIPGTSGKDVLLKPGAEKLCTLFGLTPVPEIIESITDWTGKDHNGEAFFHFTYRYHLQRNGVEIAAADGSCNSMEKKYRYRWMPAHEAAAAGVDVSTAAKQGGRISEFDFAIEKAETTGKYGKPADYWQQFKDAIQNNTAKKIEKKVKDGSTRPAWEIDSTLVRAPNPDIADAVNTIQKMAQKRALVAATLLAVNASEFYTQDLEDQIIEGSFTTRSNGKSSEPTLAGIVDEATLMLANPPKPFTAQNFDAVRKNWDIIWNLAHKAMVPAESIPDDAKPSVYLEHIIATGKALLELERNKDEEASVLA